MLLSASKVLILVVVDNGLVLYLLKRRPMHLVVLILVVVDNGLVLQNVRCFSNNEGRS